MPASIFISYCGSEGMDYAERLKKIMEDSNHSVYVAKPEDNPGDLGWDKIGNEIASRDVIIVITTACTTSSVKQKIEYNLALKKDVPFFAFVLDNSDIPNILQAPNYVRFTAEDFEDKAKTLSPKVQQLVEQKVEHPVHPVQPVQTISEDAYKTEGLHVEIVEEYRQKMVASYMQHAVVRNICSITKFNPKTDDGKPFFQVPLKERVPREWFTEEDYTNYDSSLVFSQFGQEVALGEYNLFLRLLLEQIPSIVQVTKNGINFQLIKSHALDMKTEGYHSNVLLAPIDFYVAMAGWFDKDRNAPCIVWTQSEPRLVIDNDVTLRVYWSNKFVPLQGFVIMDSNSADTWNIKPDSETGMAITAKIGINDLYPDEVTVLCKTVAKYSLSNADAVRIISITDL